MDDITVVIVGFLTVFIGMTAIVGVVYLLSYLVRVFTGKKIEKTRVNQTEEETQPITANEVVPTIEENKDDGELLAAIVASIEMYRESEVLKSGGDITTAKDFRVVSFKRIRRK